jgi:hypothetical protein
MEMLKKYVVHLSPVKYGDGKETKVFMPGDVVSIPEEVASVHPEIFKPFLEPETEEDKSTLKPEEKAKKSGRRYTGEIGDGL